MTFCPNSNTKRKHVEGGIKDEVRKTKARIELKLARNIKDHKKGLLKV